MSILPQTPEPPCVRSEPIRLGVVSFLNTLPLIDGLEKLDDVRIHRSVPSLLIDQLLAGDVDVALCSVIDYQRSCEPLVILPVGLLGCAGRTLTVRLYSTCPIEAIERVHCDADSHTSVVLMRIVLDAMHGIRPEVIDYDAREQVAGNTAIDWPETMLLIGDKVVTDSPPAVRYPHQLDLGEAWRALTGLPFVFAVWMARRDCVAGILQAASAVLDRHRRYNANRIDGIIHRQATARRWPCDLAEEYLTTLLTFECDAEHIAAIEAFFGRAHDLGLIDQLRPLIAVGADGMNRW